MATESSNPILLYDGVCGLCDRFVQFILKRDALGKFRFAALQSEFAGRILRKHDVSPEALDTVYVVLDFGSSAESLLSRSDAAIRVLRELGGFWAGLGGLLLVFPKPIRDWGYKRVAGSRYRVFGKFDACVLPDEKHRGKFLDG